MTLDLLQERLRNQLLTGSSMTEPAGVVSWMGAIQAQDYPGARWSIGLRLPGSTDPQVEQAVAAGTIHRTWAMRGTLHFVAAEDIGWILGLLAVHIIAGNARRYRELELDAGTLSRACDLIARAVSGGQELTRPQLLSMLEAEGISTRGQRAPYMLQRACLEGLACQGAAVRNIPTFRGLDLSAPGIKKLSREEALAELARRYFQSRGPAALPDFVWWSGLPAEEIRRGLELARPDLVEEKINGQSCWLARDLRPNQPTLDAALLLPGFDEYLIGYRNRSAALDPAPLLFQRNGAPANGMPDPTVAIGGKIAATWKRTFAKGRVIVAPKWFAPPSAAETEALAAAARRYGEYLGLRAEIR